MGVLIQMLKVAAAVLSIKRLHLRMKVFHSFSFLRAVFFFLLYRPRCLKMFEDVCQISIRGAVSGNALDPDQHNQSKGPIYSSEVAQPAKKKKSFLASGSLLHSSVASHRASVTSAMHPTVISQ